MHTRGTKCTTKPRLETLVHLLVLVSALVSRSFQAYADRTCTAASLDAESKSRHFMLSTKISAANMADISSLFVRSGGIYK